MNDLARATDLVLRVDAMSPLEHDVDLVAVGVVTPSGGEPLTGSVSKLDGLLGGAIEQMRTAARELAIGVPGLLAWQFSEGHRLWRNRALQAAD